MFRITLLASLILIPAVLLSQELAQVSFNGATTLNSLAFRANDNVIIKISDEGQVVEYGLPWERGRSDFYPGKLHPYEGRVDYFHNEADSILNGKLKSVGLTFFTYYSSYEIEEKRGKLRTVGTAQMDYYNNFENQAVRGKLKFAGKTMLEYYSSFDNEAFRGKLKRIGNTPLTWYSTFDDRYKAGKIKSIGNLNYTWADERGFQGTYYQTPLSPVINGVMYIVM